MAKVKTVPIKRDNKPRDKNHVGKKLQYMCRLAWCIRFAWSSLSLQALFNGFLEPGPSGREAECALERAVWALNRDISGFRCFLRNNGERRRKCIISWTTGSEFYMQGKPASLTPHLQLGSLIWAAVAVSRDREEVYVTFGNGGRWGGGGGGLKSKIMMPTYCDTLHLELSAAA